MTEAGEKTLLVLAVGNELRQDDGAGLRLGRRVEALDEGRLEVMEVFGPDLLLAEELARYPFVLILDAAAGGEPFTLHELSPSPAGWLPGSFASHLIDWPGLLAAARDLYRASPKTWLLAVRGVCFEIGQVPSPACRENENQAFDFLTADFLPKLFP